MTPTEPTPRRRFSWDMPEDEQDEFHRQRFIALRDRPNAKIRQLETLIAALQAVELLADEYLTDDPPGSCERNRDCDCDRGDHLSNPEEVREAVVMLGMTIRIVKDRIVTYAESPDLEPERTLADAVAVLAGHVQADADEPTVLNG